MARLNRNGKFIGRPTKDRSSEEAQYTGSCLGTVLLPFIIIFALALLGKFLLDSGIVK